MNLLQSDRKNPSDSDRTRLLFLSLLLSFGLHLLVFILLPLLPQQDQKQTWQPATIVHLVDKPIQRKEQPPEKRREFEIDQQPLTPQPKVPVESFRKAERDQKVDREQAPKGEDVRDQTTKPAMPVQLQKQRPKKQQQKIPDKAGQKLLQKPEVKSTPIDKDKILKKVEQKPAPAFVQPAQPESSPPPLSLEQLRPDSRTLDQIASGSQADRNRSKERKDVEIGDTIWLNLQHNLLVSFFRRFHDQIELVWNYPTKAAMNGIEGTLELLIIVNKQGELQDVDLIHSSGSDLLDNEAIFAVYRAAPFGPLTKHYPHKKLKIRAHFSYQLSGRYIYGR